MNTNCSSVGLAWNQTYQTKINWLLHLNINLYFGETKLRSHSLCDDCGWKLFCSTGNVVVSREEMLNYMS